MPIIAQEELKRILPHAYPFVLIDKVIDYEPNESLTAIKNITANEWPFNSPNPPDYFPELLLVEAAAQAGLVLYHCIKIKTTPSSVQYLLGKVKANVFNFVEIGEIITFQAFATKVLDNGGFTDIFVHSTGKEKAEIRVYYKVKRNG